MNVCNNASAVFNLQVLALVLAKASTRANIDTSAENLTGLKQSTDIVLINFNIFIAIEVNLGSRTFSQTNDNTVFHCILGY